MSSTSEIKYTPSELRQQIRDHMWALAVDDKTAQGSVDYGDFLINQLVEAVEELAIYGHRHVGPGFIHHDDRDCCPCPCRQQRHVTKS